MSQGYFISLRNKKIKDAAKLMQSSYLVSLFLPLERVTLNLKLFLDILKTRPLAGPDFKILGSFFYNFN